MIKKSEIKYDEKGWFSEVYTVCKVLEPSNFLKDPAIILIENKDIIHSFHTKEEVNSIELKAKENGLKLTPIDLSEILSSEHVADLYTDTQKYYK